jgi:hypothetical protein
MTRAIQPRPLLFPAILFTLAAACHQRNPSDSNPDFVLSKSDEGVPHGLRSGTTSPRVSGDTLVCEKPRKYRTSEGNRWLWVRILIERQPGGDTDNTVAETVVSTDPEGRVYDQKVELAGVSLDREKDYTLRNATGVRTGETKKSAKQAHSARGYTRGPDMGPLEVSCGR